MKLGVEIGLFSYPKWASFSFCIFFSLFIFGPLIFIIDASDKIWGSQPLTSKSDEQPMATIQVEVANATQHCGGGHDRVTGGSLLAALNEVPIRAEVVTGEVLSPMVIIAAKVCICICVKSKERAIEAKANHRLYLSRYRVNF